MFGMGSLPSVAMADLSGAEMSGGLVARRQAGLPAQETTSATTGAATCGTAAGAIIVDGSLLAGMASGSGTEGSEGGTDSLAGSAGGLASATGIDGTSTDACGATGAGADSLWATSSGLCPENIHAPTPPHTKSTAITAATSGNLELGWRALREPGSIPGNMILSKSCRPLEGAAADVTANGWATIGCKAIGTGRFDAGWLRSDSIATTSSFAV